MEKARGSENISPASSPPPSSSACDVLRPLSQSSSFPNSGAIAASVREEQQSAAVKPAPSLNDTSGSAVHTSRMDGAASDEMTTESVQKRSETVQHMRDVDAAGVRTWRRLIVEYS